MLTSKLSYIFISSKFIFGYRSLCFQNFYRRHFLRLRSEHFLSVHYIFILFIFLFFYFFIFFFPFIIDGKILIFIHQVVFLVVCLDNIMRLF